MGQEIMSEVFCNKYQKAYVGENSLVKEIEIIMANQVAKIGRVRLSSPLLT